MARPNRFQVAPGVTIYLRHKTWWVDIREEGSRIQRNLRTHEYGVAIRKAHDLEKQPDHLTKDREDRIVPINEVALAVLRRRKLAAGGDSGAILFPSRAGTPLDRHNVSHGFKKRARASGVPDANWYALRHTFATRLAESVPEMALAAIMGHSDPKTTSRFYVHRNRMNLPTPPVVGLGG